MNFIESTELRRFRVTPEGGESFESSFAELADANGDDPELLDLLYGMDVHESEIVGGGAAGLFKVTRLDDAQ